MKIILASKSPRRRALLEQIGMKFEVAPAQGEEETRFVRPWEAVMDLAAQKAREAAMGRDGLEETVLVIGADTVVALGDEILGKPRDEEDAYRMLSLLQGTSHKVYTGVSLLLLEGEFLKSHIFYRETEVVMHPMSEEERRWYIGIGEPFDKAGGYGIQGRCAVFIQEIRGDYNNVVGLPGAGIYQELKKLGIDMDDLCE